MTAAEPLNLDPIWDRSTNYMALWDAVADQPTPEQMAAAVATAEDVRALLAEVERLTAANANLIGPLTAEEWCEFRHRDDDGDLLQCCGITSDMRRAIFYVLRSGGDRDQGRGTFALAYADMLNHDLPEGHGGELLERLRAYYLPGQTDDDIRAKAARVRETLTQLEQEAEGATR
jgi:hypothetical protein